MHPDYLTARQASRASGFSLKVIHRLFDSREIAGFRIPGSTHRRILRRPFLEYLAARNIPVFEGDVK